MISKILTNSALTVLTPELKKPFVISRDHKLFTDILDAVNAKDKEALLKFINIAQSITDYSKGGVQIVDGELLYNGEAVHSLLSERILELYHNDLDYEYMAKFLENLMLNPSYQSRQELYLFLENGNMPITEDGRFLAYKWVRDDYFDCHTGKFAQNVPGAIIKMDRTKVNDDRQQTCSSGLHVCTHAYTAFGQRLMVVAVNPKDVVSVPYDYDNAKMRVAEYEVLYEVNSDQYVSFNGGVVSNKDGSQITNNQGRDSRGRFTRKVA